MPQHGIIIFSLHVKTAVVEQGTRALSEVLESLNRDFKPRHDIKLIAAILAAYVGHKKMAAVSSISYIMTRVKVSNGYLRRPSQ